MDTKTARIRALNDQLRRHLADGIAVMTPGVAALGVEAVQRIVKTIALFDDFCHTNDPYEEHDPAARRGLLSAKHMFDGSWIALTDKKDCRVAQALLHAAGAGGERVQRVGQFSSA